MVTSYVKVVVHPSSHPHYHMTTFNSMSNLCVSMFSQVLGLDIDVYINKIVLVLLVSLFHATSKTNTKFS